MGQDVTKKAKLRRVDQMLREVYIYRNVFGYSINKIFSRLFKLIKFNLEKSADVLIGIVGKIRGISGGEKKRLSFATEVEYERTPHTSLSVQNKIFNLLDSD